ncbi:uncharacterized protein BCR38DRAFT_459515 [Pseudomassariella vexata]|uniref:Uncharacterized protein n=1 Tax=Pseudomassariella vexata TaxID=1141098 RepID=A0A1Y2DQX7_9PEZI|nr:uncharacterized protein BCR38DRAFT_459515 [Pseudomassariella vexata]ORY61712.1 hypothetical protein BCR38DRAFT_459515 [Pseudomassariella vexata]
MSKSPKPSTPVIQTISHAHRMIYRIGRGQQGQRFLEFDEQGDFVGMDMARKFIQMGMTRAKRYGNHAGGRKYKKEIREELPKSEEHEGKQEKEEVSKLFREVWERCRAYEGYKRRRAEFLRELREWEEIKKEEEVKVET